jgi:hypothetical protein
MRPWRLRPPPAWAGRRSGISVGMVECEGARLLDRRLREYRRTGYREYNGDCTEEF